MSNEIDKSFMGNNMFGLEQYGFVHILISVIFIIMSVLILVNIVKGLIQWIKFIKEDKEITDIVNGKQTNKSNN